MNTLVSDFDGTLTRRDFYDLVRERWPLPPDDDPWENYVAGRITHFDALAQIFARIRTSEETLDTLADGMGLAAGLATAIQSLREHDWTVVVASAGCEWYIQRLLAQAGVTLTVHSNPGTFDPKKGLLMRPPQESRFFSPATGVDKLAIVRDALERSDKVAFAGDGRPDLEPSLLVPPDLRFARGWLAEALAERGEKFHAFEEWPQIADRLIAC